MVTMTMRQAIEQAVLDLRDTGGTILLHQVECADFDWAADDPTCSCHPLHLDVFPHDQPERLISLAYRDGVGT